MTKFQELTVTAFIVGLILMIIGIVIALVFQDVAIFWVKLTLGPATILLCGSTIISALNPIEEE